MDGWNTNFLLGWTIFRGYVSFRECRSPHIAMRHDHFGSPPPRPEQMTRRPSSRAYVKLLLDVWICLEESVARSQNTQKWVPHETMICSHGFTFCVWSKQDFMMIIQKLVNHQPLTSSTSRLSWSNGVTNKQTKNEQTCLSHKRQEQN